MVNQVSNQRGRSRSVIHGQVILCWLRPEVLIAGVSGSPRKHVQHVVGQYNHEAGHEASVDLIAQGEWAHSSHVTPDGHLLCSSPLQFSESIIRSDWHSLSSPVGNHQCEPVPRKTGGYFTQKLPRPSCGYPA